MQEKRNRPKVRFRGFEDEWKDSPFEEIFNGISNNTLSRADLNYHSGLSKNIHYGDVLIKFGEVLDIETNKIPFISNDLLAIKFKASKLQDGDIIIADAAEDEAVGKCTEVINIGNQSVYSGLHTIPARPKNPFAPRYLGYYMNSLAYHGQLLKLMQGTKVLSISKSAIKDTWILYPSNPEEQSRIGTFFQYLDKLLTFHHQQGTKLITLKKAMLEKMFPGKDADVPEVRFKGFEGEWQDGKLGDYGKVSMNKRIFKNQTTESGEIPFYKIGTFGKEPDSFISRELFEEFKSKYPYPKVGDILISASGSIGRTVEYLGKDEYFQDSNIVWLDHGGKLDNLFLRQFYTIVKWHGLEGSTIQRLYNKSILETNIKVPSNRTEQTRIGTYFQNLDRLITQHQTQLTKLQNIKKACLEKMFV